MTGEPGVCKAKLKCRYGENTSHYSSLEEARDSYAKSQESPIAKELKRPAEVKKQLPPIILDPSPYPNPTEWNWEGDHILDVATDIDYVDYYDSGYSAPTFIDLDLAVATGMGLPREDWPGELETLVNANSDDWADVDNWDLDGGYYEGDPMTFSPPRHLKDTLRNWYYSQRNAVDNEGILEHVREKGHDTAGLDPIQAVKTMLREENKMVLKHVERATHVQAEEVNFKDLYYSESHFNNIEPKSTTPKSPRSLPIVGVIKRQRGRLQLLDGHHRLKFEQSRGDTVGRFIVLS